MKLLQQIEIPNYPRKILLSKARRAKYFKQSDKLPLKYLQKGTVEYFVDEGNSAKDKDGNIHLLKEEYVWLKNCLFSTATNEWIIKNTKVAGTERWELINGQKMYDFSYNPTQGLIIDVIHRHFWKYLKDIEPIKESPIFIHYHFDCFITNPSDQDLDNYALPYYKSFQDTLVETNILSNDSFKQVKGFKVTGQEREKGIEERYTGLNFRDKPIDLIHYSDLLTVKIYANTV